MKKVFLAALTLIVLSLTGCGSGSGHHSDPVPPFSAQILSDATLDGHIFKPFGSGTVPIPYQDAAESYLAGFDSSGEWRAFLQFPLASVPAGADIQSATLDLLVYSVQPNPLLSTVPIRIELVDLDPPKLFLEDFDQILQPALASITASLPISPTSFGQHVLIDVTALMQTAQYWVLPILQVRILVDQTKAISGLIEINDSTGVDRATLAPLLDVSYY